MLTPAEPPWPAGVSHVPNPVLRRHRLTCLDDLDVNAARVCALSRAVIHDEAVAPSIVGLPNSLTAQRAEPLALVWGALARRMLLEAHADDDRIDLHDVQAQRHAGRDLAPVERQARVIDADDLAGFPGARWVYGFHGL